MRDEPTAFELLADELRRTFEFTPQQVAELRRVLAGFGGERIHAPIAPGIARTPQPNRTEGAARFVDELLRTAGDDATRRRMAAVLRKWGGSRVYVHRLDLERPREAARRLLDAHVTATDASAILAARFGLSGRHCRRIVRDEVCRRGQEMAAPAATLPA